MQMKSHDISPPNGWRYLQSETNFTPERYSSFSSVVDQVIAHRLANPYLIQKNLWSVDRATVEFEVDSFNAAFCRQMGGQYLSFLAEGGPGSPPPFPTPPQPQLLSPPSGGVAVVKKLASGAALLFEWTESGMPPVIPEISARRAEICSTCPKNSQKEVGEWFTSPIAEGIRRRIGRLNEMNLTTPFDSSLGICEACLCPLKLKSHTPLELILKRLSPQVRSELDPRCWILSETP